jgi:peptidylprolyl isomerase
MRTLFAAAAMAACLLAGSTAARADSDNTLILELRTGAVTIEMRPDLAPNHVARIRELVRQGFYNGLKFHRVIEGFMAQTGDPKGDGTGGSGQTLKAEFTKTPFVRGVVGMARSQDPDSADSQFFIMFEASPQLNNQYTVWGEVVEGMEHVDRIKKGEPYLNGVVQNPDRIVRLSVLGDKR